MKTRNYSIRFEEEHFEFICERENLSSAQKVVTFLLLEYVRRHRGTGGGSILNSLSMPTAFSPEKPAVKEEISASRFYQNEIDNFRGGQEEGEILMRKILAAAGLTKWQRDSLKIQLNSKALQ